MVQRRRHSARMQTSILFFAWSMYGDHLIPSVSSFQIESPRWHRLVPAQRWRKQQQQQQQQRLRSVLVEECNEKDGEIDIDAPLKPPFQVFQEENLARIAASDQFLTDAKANSVTPGPDGHNAHRKDADTETGRPLSMLEPTYRWEDVQQLVSQQGSRQACKQFADNVNANGGYVFIKLNQTDQETVRSMWSSMARLFHRSDEDHSIPLQHQTLTREDTATAHQTSGYKFVQTFLHGHELLPDYLATDEEDYRNLERAYHLFSTIAEETAIAALSGMLDKPPAVMRSFTNGLLHDTQRFSGAYHRLSRYVSAKQHDGGGDNDADRWNESLRSHTDWTLTTPIPMSQTPGLEVWRSHDETWIRPEALIQQSTLNNNNNNNNSDDDDDDSGNTAYVIVMIGKWMELITNKEMESCIHRVVCDQSIEARMSAPFFMRPKELLFRQIDQEFNQPSRAETLTSSSKQAMQYIADFFQGFIHVVESSMTPEASTNRDSQS